MVFVTQAVVHESAMMVEFLHTTLTVRAVEGPSRFDHAAIKTEVA